MKPSYEIYADGKRVTSAFQGRLKSIAITDVAAEASDELSIEIEDTGGRLAVPRKGAEIEIHIGYGNNLKNMGQFTVDDVEMSGPPDQISIKAKSATFVDTDATGLISSRKSRSWDNISYGNLVETIAAEDGLTSSVATSLASRHIPHVDQTNESDMNLITRLARDMDAYAKISQDHIIVNTNASVRSAIGKAMGAINLMPKDISKWQVKLGDKDKFGTACADWNDIATGQRRRETTGAGEPVYIAPNVFSSKEEAQDAIAAYLRNFSRRGSELTITMPGRVDLAAECKINMSGFRDGVNGEWAAKRVEHTISGRGYTTTAKCEVIPAE